MLNQLLRVGQDFAQHIESLRPLVARRDFHITIHPDHRTGYSSFLMVETVDHLRKGYSVDGRLLNTFKGKTLLKAVKHAATTEKLGLLFNRLGGVAWSSQDLTKSCVVWGASMPKFALSDPSLPWQALGRAWFAMDQVSYTIPLLANMSLHEKMALQTLSPDFFRLVERVQTLYEMQVHLYKNNGVVLVASFTGSVEEPRYQMLDVVYLHTP